jgi:hypothetical protein
MCSNLPPSYRQIKAHFRTGVRKLIQDHQINPVAPVIG